MLEFLPGERLKFINVTIVDNPVPELEKIFRVELYSIDNRGKISKSVFNLLKYESVLQIHISPVHCLDCGYFYYNFTENYNFWSFCVFSLWRSLCFPTPMYEASLTTPFPLPIILYSSGVISLWLSCVIH